MRRLALLVVGAVAGASATAVAVRSPAFLSAPAVAASADTFRHLRLLGDVFEKIRADYVETPDERKLIEAAINGMMASLGSNAEYIDRKTLREMRYSSRYTGFLGLDVTTREGTLRVVTTYDDTPAARAGIMANDVITQIDDDQVQGLTPHQALEKRDGPIGTPVRLTIQRAGKAPFEVTLIRSRFPLRPPSARVEGGDVAYLRFSIFQLVTPDGLRSQIEKLTNEIGPEKFKGFVIDLRNTSGGVDEAVMVADAFLDSGEIVSTRGRNADANRRFEAKPGDLAEGKPVVVLINGGSAGASEIVAGALQDHKRAYVIGARSFGKGDVPAFLPLGEHGGVRLTIAHCHTPSGRSIEAKGIEPDLEIAQDVPYELLRNDPTKDKQLIAAVDYVKGVRKGAANTTPPPVEAPKTDKPAVPN